MANRFAMQDEFSSELLKLGNYLPRPPRYFSELSARGLLAQFATSPTGSGVPRRGRCWERKECSRRSERIFVWGDLFGL